MKFERNNLVRNILEEIKFLLEIEIFEIINNFNETCLTHSED